MVDILILVGVVVCLCLGFSKKIRFLFYTTVLQVYNILQILSYHQYNNAVSILSISYYVKQLQHTTRKQTTTTLISLYSTVPGHDNRLFIYNLAVFSVSLIVHSPNHTVQHNNNPDLILSTNFFFIYIVILILLQRIPVSHNAKKNRTSFQYGKHALFNLKIKHSEQVK